MRELGRPRVRPGGGQLPHPSLHQGPLGCLGAGPGVRGCGRGQGQVPAAEGGSSAAVPARPRSTGLPAPPGSSRRRRRQRLNNPQIDAAKTSGRWWERGEGGGGGSGRFSQDVEHPSSHRGCLQVRAPPPPPRTRGPIMGEKAARAGVPGRNLGAERIRGTQPECWGGRGQPLHGPRRQAPAQARGSHRPRSLGAPPRPSRVGGGVRPA